jgi:hypothetical protein
MFSFRKLMPSGILIFFSIITVSCSDPGVLISPYHDDFSRDSLGPDYFDTIGRYLIIKGELNILGGFNHPLWLKKPLPANVNIEFDARSLSPEGDIKFELFGDGSSYSFNKGKYLADGYVFCMGGWNNTKTFIARRDEHAKNLLHTVKTKVVSGKKHHFKVESRLSGGILKITWYIDQEKVLEMRDSQPLYNSKNRFFAFSNWNTDVYFDNLAITPIN